VLALDFGRDTSELIDFAETFYRDRGAPTLIQVSNASAPRDLATQLRTCGYRPSAHTLVQRAPASEVLERTKATLEVEITVEPTDEWFDAFWSIESVRGRSDTDASVYRDTLLAPGLPMAFAAARRGSDVVGVGQIVIERGWAGVQCMATSPAHRRQGVGDAVLHGLGNEALRQRAGNMYLAVMSDNDAATVLYERAGFTTVHEYSYFSTDSAPTDLSGTIARSGTARS
jgi:GNAT superfamily N-acetyltransferase